MNIPVLCSQCGAHLRLDVSTDTKKFVAVCSECDSVYDLASCQELDDEVIRQIVSRFEMSDMEKTLSYMVRKV